MKFKNLLYATIASVFALCVPLAQAEFAYQSGDAILVLWANTYDSVNFDLGNVSQFLNHTNGYQVQVASWDPNVATTYLGPFPANGGYVSLNFNIGAANTSTHTPYVTDSLSASVPTTVDRNVTASGLDNYGGNLVSVSSGTAIPTAQTGDAFSTNWAVLVPTDTRAYDYNPSTGNEGDWGVSYLPGNVYAGIPGAIPFWQVGVGTSTQLGTFQFTADGRLFFTVGSILNKATITNFAYDGVTEADVTFNTVIGANYQLLESTNLALPLSSWTVVSDAVVDYPSGGTSTGSVLGDGNPHTLSDLNATNSPSFYVIESY